MLGTPRSAGRRKLGVTGGYGGGWEPKGAPDSSRPLAPFERAFPPLLFPSFFLSGGDSYFSIFQLRKDQILSRW